MASLWLTLLAGILCLTIQQAHGDTSTSLTMTLTPSMSSMLSSMPPGTVTPTAAKPSPSPPSSSSSLSPPSSSILVSPTPPPPPTPPPTPVASNEFILTRNITVNGTTVNVTCVHVKTSLELFVSYKNSSNKTNSMELRVTKNMFPRVDHVRSRCSNISADMTLAFQNSSSTNYTHFITFHFRLKDKNTSYELTAITTSLDPCDNAIFPALDTNTSLVNGTTDEKDGIFRVSNNRSYKCSSSRSFSMTTSYSLNVKNMSVKLYDFQAQAISFKNGSDFGSRTECSSDQKSSKIVPIAVGAALAGLVVVVLIAYLIGRFRSRKQNSYEALS